MEVKIENKDIAPRVLKRLVQKEYRKFVIEEPSLNEIFLLK